MIPKTIAVTVCLTYLGTAVDALRYEESPRTLRKPPHLHSKFAYVTWTKEKGYDIKMESRKFAVFIVAALQLLSCSPTQAQNLTAVKCNAVLPKGQNQFAILYDQDDSIYIFGGWDGSTGESLDDVLKYSIREDRIQLVGHLPSPEFGAAVVMNKLGGDIFYLSGSGQNNTIYQFSPELRTFVNVSSLEENMSRSGFAAIRPGDMDTSLLFGGYPSPAKTIISLNLSSLESEEIGELTGVASRPSAIWVEEQDAAYIFQDHTIQRFVRSSNRTEQLFLEPPISDLGSYGAVSNGRVAYLFGKIASGNPPQSILRFDPATETVRLIPVEDYVPLLYTSAVYIQKLNRIYTFDGFVYTGEIYHDEIRYIDLDPPLNPAPSH